MNRYEKSQKLFEEAKDLLPGESTLRFVRSNQSI